MSSTTNPSAQHTSTIGAIGAPSRRNTELALLAFAVVIPVFAYANVGLAIDGSVPSGLLAYGLGLGLMAAVGHLVMRKFAAYADPLLLPLATLLNGLGLVAALATGPVRAVAEPGGAPVRGVQPVGAEPAACTRPSGWLCSWRYSSS
ncbi:hypothetical protein SHIRM173S_00034 [Streptomyces hirsutus]